MRALAVSALTILSAVFASSAAAVDTPRPSPQARVEQVVGITTVAIDYSSPAKRGRVLWGELVPYGEPWRAGANAPTTLTVAHDFEFGSAKVPAGSYRVVTLPGKEKWTFILNSKLGGGGASYDSKFDVARVSVAPTSAPTERERMTFFFEDTTENSTKLALHWGELHVAVPIRVATSTLVAKAIDEALASAWRPHYESARYYAEKGDADRAIELFNRSIAIEANAWNVWFQAQALAKAGRTSDAHAAAKKAKTLGKKDPMFTRYFGKEVDKAISTWGKN